jgi:hypothetical protein
MELTPLVESIVTVCLECASFGEVAISVLGDKRLNPFAFVVNGTPEIIAFAINPHENLIQMLFSAVPKSLALSVAAGISVTTGPSFIPRRSNSLHICSVFRKGVAQTTASNARA